MQHYLRDTVPATNRPTLDASNTEQPEAPRQRTYARRPSDTNGAVRRCSPSSNANEAAVAAQRLRTARALNMNMRWYSSHATLIVTNLPLMMSMSSVDFLMCVDVMTRGLEAVMLVRGSGTEVVTTFA